MALMHSRDFAVQERVDGMPDIEKFATSTKAATQRSM